MTRQTLICLFLVIHLRSSVSSWCLYFCPHNKQQETVCAVDPQRGAKLFHGRCQVWKENYCFTAAYEELDMQQCVDRHPEALYSFLTDKGKVEAFLKTGAHWGVRPFRRFIWLYSLLGRLVPRPPLPPLLPLLIWALLQPPRGSPFNMPQQQPFFGPLPIDQK